MEESRMRIGFGKRKGRQKGGGVGMVEKSWWEKWWSMGVTGRRGGRSDANYATDSDNQIFLLTSSCATKFQFKKKKKCSFFFVVL